MQGVRSRQCGREIVHDHVLGDATEEGPSRLQPGNDVLQRLAEGGPDEAVPGVAQHQQEGPHRAAAARVRIVNQAKAAEIQLHHLSGSSVLHADGPGIAPPPPVAVLDEAAQRRVGNLATPLQQQFQYAGYLQAIGVEPLVYLVAPRCQQIPGGSGRYARAGTPYGRQPAELLLGRSRATLAYTLIFGCGHVFPDRVSRQSRTRGYVPETDSPLPAPDDFRCVHPGHLLVGHRYTSQ